MLKRTTRNRTLCTKGVTEYEVKECCDHLLTGGKVVDVPTRLCKSVISTLTHMRKDALLHNRDGVAAKIDDILGEMKHGPQRYTMSQAERPNTVRTRSLNFNHNERDNNLRMTNKTLTRGAHVESVDSPTRQACTPVLKEKRKRECSRAHYPKSAVVDRTVDQCVEYELDSRRLSPRLLKVAELQRRLDEARGQYEHYRERAKGLRILHEQIREGAAADLDDRLTSAMLDYGSHVPTVLPLEFSKFSGKALDMRERERKSAHFRGYDDAQALRKESSKKEKEELQVLGQRFARSFTLQKKEMLRKQDQKRVAFDDLWTRKKEKTQREISAKMSELKRAVDHLERDLLEAQKAAGGEMVRIKNNERLVSTPVLGKPAASPRRF